MENRINVTKSLMPPFEEYMEEIRPMWESHWLTNIGVKHQKLEDKLKEYLQVSHVSLMSNGHMALELALQALDLKGEVITTPFTFASTTHAIVRNNLEPVFCDIDPIDFTIDVKKIEALVTDKTSAILPVHVYGNICNIEAVEQISNKYGLKVIYDAAHAFGVTYRDAGVGNFGDASVFSFHATKVYNTIEGGAVCFKDKEFDRKLYRLKNFGIRNEEVVDGIGANAKMNEFQASMGLCNLRYIDEEIERRRHLTECYRERLAGKRGIQLNVQQEHVKSNYAYYPIIIDEEQFGASRDQVCEELKTHGIYVRKYFYPITSEFSCYQGQFASEKTPVAWLVSKRVITLPLYGELEERVIHKICDIILSMAK
ncbi:MAG: DegT/DnrJ/EryC1/StrS family aminotransferase [Lachnospiraceae bacterium]|nr:DegT/DnrJ/EryC1/StrS family aminotransferase [Lachnospiraceae bacterium]